MATTFSRLLKRLLLTLVFVSPLLGAYCGQKDDLYLPQERQKAKQPAEQAATPAKPAEPAPAVPAKPAEPAPAVPAKPAEPAPSATSPPPVTNPPAAPKSH
jgi:predicted small lipoprotein YifL